MGATNSIRPATEQDLEGAIRLITELGYPDLSPSAFAETYYSVLRHPAMTVIVCEGDDGEIIAMATLSRRPQLRLAADLITIDEFVVGSAARGRGVGGALLEHIKAMARTAGAFRLELNTNRARTSYRRGFYIKNGFTEADSAIMRIDYHSDDE
jgi:GNAT superfamily N-acetyltransferase